MNEAQVLARYINGSLTPGTPSSQISFSTSKSYNRNDLVDELDNTFTNGYNQIETLQCKDENGNYNGYVIAYGNYYTDSSHSYSAMKGYILLLDNQYTKVALITQFSSGTDFRAFARLSIDEKGQLYGIDVMQDGNDQIVRWILMNNVSVKGSFDTGNKVKLRKSYIWQVQLGLPNINYINKDLNGSNYVAVNRTGDLFEFKINVGSTNEWNKYTRTNPAGTESSHVLQGCITTWNSNNELNFIGYSEVQISGHKHIYKFTIDNDTLTGTDIFDIHTKMFSDTPDIVLSTSTIGFFTIDTTSNLLPITTDSFYYMVGGTVNGTTYKYKCVYYNITTDTLVEKISETYTENVSIPRLYETFFNLNGTIFVNYRYALDNNNFELMTALINYDLTTAKQVVSYGTANDLDKFLVFDVNNQFNLYRVNALHEYNNISFLHTTYILFNRSTYTGTYYLDYNSLKPKYMTLYSSTDNDVPIYSRNISNLLVYGNVCESTMVIPNQMLNDVIIKKKELFGETNVKLTFGSMDTTNLEKNSYEELSINCFRRIKIIDNIDSLNRAMLEGSNRLNDSISKTLDMNNVKLDKCRINYVDGTSEIFTCTCSVGTMNNGIRHVVIPKKKATTLDILSDDETLIYASIDVSNYIPGYRYDISNYWRIVYNYL